ncbi:hypothetical protein LZ198_32475 [Myxococcus sp. K15C18031901]|uniref:hypothetical protein n=1 Tax=Myxococcus dinghuensis TaxID=2906761 RepID=UPI0020A75FFA|nr:hypothetical protein [Myxococcus dinghuensis]MCP3103610.1 hypothetical protein [Myxococcus dinghuensis]
MRGAMRTRWLALGLMSFGPLGAHAQSAGEATITLPEEKERGCPNPKKLDLVPFTPRSQVGLGGAGWLMHQAVIPDAKDVYFTDRERERSGVKQVAPEDARKLGAPDPTLPVWVFGKADAAPCRAEPVLWWAARMGTDGDRKTFLLAEVKADCDLLPPGRLSGTPVAVRQKDAPTGCKLRRPNERETGKVGEGLPSDALEFVPARDCEAPECSRVWERFGASWDDSSAASDLTVAWMSHEGKKDPCDWSLEHFSLLLYRPTGALSPVQLRGGGTHLFGGLYDSSGPRVVLSRDLGTLYAHDAARPKAPPKAVRYGSPSEEDLANARRSLSTCKSKR